MNYKELFTNCKTGFDFEDNIVTIFNTLERLFGTAKEHHGFRYTQLKGKARMDMKVGLTYACLKRSLARLRNSFLSSV